MRLMFVTGSLAHGGAEHHSVVLTNRLAERGHDCHVVYVKPAHDQLARLTVHATGSVLCLGARCYLDLAAMRRFAAHLASIRPAALIAANPYALMYATLARRLSRLRPRVVVTYHSTRWPGLKEQAKLLAYRPFMWSADCAVFVCQYQRHYCARRALLARRNAVIHNGVDTQRFCDRSDAAARRALRTALGYADSDYVVAMVAALRAEKNHRQLVEAIARLRVLGIAAKALLVGDGPLRGEVESHARALAIDRHVAITGFRADVRPYLTACDAVAVCSLTEALSLSAIEAMAMARPLVHSEVGGAAELIDAGRTGLLFPVGDTHALVECLVRVANCEAARQMGAAARGAAESIFGEQRMVDRYEQLLSALCESQPAPRLARAALLPTRQRYRS